MEMEMKMETMNVWETKKIEIYLYLSNINT